jgi:hypothetical protein
LHTLSRPKRRKSSEIGDKRPRRTAKEIFTEAIEEYVEPDQSEETENDVEAHDEEWTGKI